MDIHKLDRIFKPKRIALIGVTTNPNSVGGKVLSNLVGSGFKGVVYPVNPQCEAVLGIQCYSGLDELPKTPDLAVICTPAEQVPQIIKECGEAGIFGIIIMSAGFREAGSEGRELESQILKEAEKYEEMRIIGPNCLGIIVPELKLNVTFANGTPDKGNVAFISQSGALCTSVLDWAIKEKIGFSYFVSIGNTLDVNFGDLIDYFGEDEKTRSIILYVESINQARDFLTAARAFARNKPIVVYKAGRFPESAEVAHSHTGAMATEDAVYDAAFQRIGLARVFDIGDIFDVAELIGKHKYPRGSRLGIITNAGGPGVMATDTLISLNGTLAELSDETIDKLNEKLPPFWSKGNPVDVLGDARSKRLSKAAKIVLDDPGVDALLVILTPQAMTNPSSAAKAITKLSEETKKPILAAWLGGKSMEEGISIFNDAGIPSYMTPEQAIRAFMTLVSYSKNLESLYETPREIKLDFPTEREMLRSKFSTLIADKGDILNEDFSKSLLEAYGIPVSRTHRASNSSEAVRLADKIGYPVVLKIDSPDITHKSDIGGVALDIENETDVRFEFDKIVNNAREKFPEASIEGVTVQKMYEFGNSIELILGIKKDPIFGSVLMVGTGGTTAEIFGDRTLGLPPLNERLSRKMLESLKIWPLLEGYRGNPPVDIDKIVEILTKLSYIAVDYPEITELDVNPLLVSPEGAIALDARVIVDKKISYDSENKYKHLAMRPYPEEYVESVILRDGQRVLFRPIKPEDEPMWFELLGSCSRESIYMRFRYFFQWHTHEVASRYCFIDYDREIAIVAEVNDGEQRKLIGVGRLVADPDHESVEYAVLVSDDWQNLGLGSLLTDYCFEIAKKWGLRKIVAQTTKDNPRMIAVFKRRGFEVEYDDDSEMVEVSKELKDYS